MELGQIVGWKAGETTKRKSVSHNKLPSPCLRDHPNTGLSQGLITFPPSSVCSVAANQWPTDSLCPSLVSARNGVIKPWPWAPFIHFLCTVTPRNGRGEGLLWRLLHQSPALMKMWSTGRTHWKERCWGGSQSGIEWYKASYMILLSSADVPPPGKILYTFNSLSSWPQAVQHPSPPNICTENPPLCTSSGQCQVWCPAQIKKKKKGFPKVSIYPALGLHTHKINWKFLPSLMWTHCLHLD